MFKPLLAATLDNLDDLTYPVIVSHKLDGIRAIVINGGVVARSLKPIKSDYVQVVSRSLKPIKNDYVQFLFGKPEFNGLDGELIVGDPCSKSCYRDTNSGVMSKDGQPDVFYHVFDRVDKMHLGFSERYGTLPATEGRIVRVPHHFVTCKEQLLELEEKFLTAGMEGAMLRSPGGTYKFGRSTVKEGILLKLKRFSDGEYEVVGYEERMHNGNEATKDALGHTERSSHAAGKTGRGDLGALICRSTDPDKPVTFNVGTGFDDATRAELWGQRESLIGKLVKVKSFLIGVKDKPRFPVYLGLRSLEDMS